MSCDAATKKGWRFESGQWIERSFLTNGLVIDGRPIFTRDEGGDTGVRFRDLDNDGGCELIVGNQHQNAVFAWSEQDNSWKKLAYNLPADTSIVDGQGRDAGLRFVDVTRMVTTTSCSRTKSGSHFTSLLQRPTNACFGRGWTARSLPANGVTPTRFR